MIEWLEANRDGFLLNTFYDIFKFTIGYIVAQLLYHWIYMKLRYGGWTIMLHDKEDKEVIRPISPLCRQRMLRDHYELSIYIKSFVSPYFYLNIDISSNKAKEIGLLVIDKEKREVFIDKTKNPASI